MCLQIHITPCILIIVTKLIGSITMKPIKMRPITIKMQKIYNGHKILDTQFLKKYQLHFRAHIIHSSPICLTEIRPSYNLDGSICYE